MIGADAEGGAETGHLDLLGGGDGVRVGGPAFGVEEDVLRGEAEAEGGDGVFDGVVVGAGAVSGTSRVSQAGSFCWGSEGFIQV